MKVDVEGNEYHVFSGAKETLARAGDFCLVFEAHPRQVRRTGIDPSRVMRLVNRIRGCRFFLCEEPGREVSPDRGFYDQVSPDRVYNLLCPTRS